jgi:voltage-gated potassium channel
VLRQTLYVSLFPEGRNLPGLTLTNKVICVLIVAAALISILETEAVIHGFYENFFYTVEIFFLIVFSIEYVARMYAAGEDPRYRGIPGRIKYFFSPWALIDLLALAPSLIGFFVGNAFMLRLVRVFRLLRLSRLGRFSEAWSALARAIQERAHELMLSAGVAGLLLLLSSTLLFVSEASVQPHDFGSIPRALWWSIATLTTVGYGDVTPITTMGKLFAGLTAIAGIGLIAMPTGILAAAFSDVFQRRRSSRKEQ